MLIVRRIKYESLFFCLFSVEYNVESPNAQEIVTPWAAVNLKLDVKADVKYISSSLKINI